MSLEAQLIASHGGIAALAHAIDVGEVSGQGLDPVRFADEAAARLADPARGAHHTPWPVAVWLADQLAAGPGVVLDPACGAGHLLIAVAGGAARPADAWHGWDVSAEAVAATRVGLWLATARIGRPRDFVNVRLCDSALAPPEVTADSVIANPPFLSIRRLNREKGSAYVDRLRSALPRLRGNFDLYLAFLLRLSEWRARGGRFAWVLPETVWSAAYAEPGREWLSMRLETIARVSPRGAFGGAAVQATLVIGAEPRSTPPRRVALQVSSGGVVAGPDLSPEPQPLSAKAVVLADVAAVHGGTPGYRAQAMAAELLESDRASNCDTLPFVVSGCIAPYRVSPGPLRFMRRRYQRPVAPIAALSPGKHRLFSRPKIIVPGICRSLEAARDAVGVALGVGTYAVVPHEIKPELLLAVLNSESVSAWYRARFRGRELSGGYFALNCSNLRQLPVPGEWVNGPAEQVVAWVQEREVATSAARIRRLDDDIERCVKRLLFCEGGEAD